MSEKLKAGDSVYFVESYDGPDDVTHLRIKKVTVKSVGKTIVLDPRYSLGFRVRWDPGIVGTLIHQTEEAAVRYFIDKQMNRQREAKERVAREVADAENGMNWAKKWLKENA